MGGCIGLNHKYAFDSFERFEMVERKLWVFFSPEQREQVFDYSRIRQRSEKEDIFALTIDIVYVNCLPASENAHWKHGCDSNAWKGLQSRASRL